MEEEKKAISSFMSEERTFTPPDNIKNNAYISSMAKYQEMWKKSIKEPDSY